MTPVTWTRIVVVEAVALVLAACGGSGNDDTTTASTAAPAPVTSTPVATPTTTAPTIAAAPLIASSATPVSVNGTLNVSAGISEVGVSNATGGFSAAGPNDYCRVAIYEIVDSGDSRKYDLSVVFAKSDKAASYVSLSLNGGGSPFNARVATPVPGVTVDIVARRIRFANTTLGAGATYSATLNGTLDYPTQSAAGDRASCG